VRIISKYPDKVCEASRTLDKIGGETEWMTRKLHTFPKIFPNSFSSLLLLPSLEKHLSACGMGTDDQGLTA